MDDSLLVRATEPLEETTLLAGIGDPGEEDARYVAQATGLPSGSVAVMRPDL